MKRSPTSAFLILLWSASLACVGIATVPTLDPNAAETAIVETIIALQAQTTPSAAATTTLELPTATSLASFTPEPTGTSTVPMISVTVDTNCRVGPGKDYERVGILLVGETTQIVGRDAFGQYWYVRNPDVGPEHCWMSGEYAIITGNYLALLIQTPPGAQALDFEADYRGQGQCSGEFWSDIRLRNLSRGTFKSINLVAKDTDTNTVRSLTGNEFTFVDSCASPRTVETIVENGTVMISTPAFSYNLNAHNMSVTITLCTETNLTGQCVTKIITYVP